MSLFFSTLAAVNAYVRPPFDECFQDTEGYLRPSTKILFLASRISNIGHSLDVAPSEILPFRPTG